MSCRLDYCNSLLYGIADSQLRRLQSVQNAATRLITATREHITQVLQSLHLLPVRQRILLTLAVLVHKCLKSRWPGLDRRRRWWNSKFHQPEQHSASDLLPSTDNAS